MDHPRKEPNPPLGPVHRDRVSSKNDRPGPADGVALCLSGGGYRAMLFHLGALWRLNELGYLARLNRVSSVSGGSITAGVLALAWPRLDFDATASRDELRRSSSSTRSARSRGTTVDVWRDRPRDRRCPATISDRVAGAYRRAPVRRRDAAGPARHARGSSSTRRTSRPARSSASRSRTSRDYRVGEVPNPAVPLAAAVAASSAFPPFLSPAS